MPGYLEPSTSVPVHTGPSWVCEFSSTVILFSSGSVNSPAKLLLTCSPLTSRYGPLPAKCREIAGTVDVDRNARKLPGFVIGEFGSASLAVLADDLQYASAPVKPLIVPPDSWTLEMKMMRT